MNDFYIILLNYCAWEEVVTCYSMLKKQKKVNMKFIVVDNQSPDDSFLKLTCSLGVYSDVVVVKAETNGGYAMGNNFGVAQIPNDFNGFLVVTNTDIIISNDMLLHDMAEKYKSLENAGIMAPFMLNNDGSAAKLSAWKLPGKYFDFFNTLFLLRRFSNRSILYPDLKLDSGVREVDVLPGSFFVTTIKLFNEIGCFDENTFLFVEERILAYKIKKQGYRNYLDTDLKYIHLESTTIKKKINSIGRIKILHQSRFYYNQNYNKLNKLQLNCLKVLQIFGLFEVCMKNIIFKFFKKKWR